MIRLGNFAVLAMALSFSASAIETASSVCLDAYLKTSLALHETFSNRNLTALERREAELRIDAGKKVLADTSQFCKALDVMAAKPESSHLHRWYHYRDEGEIHAFKDETQEEMDTVFKDSDDVESSLASPIRPAFSGLPLPSFD